MRRGSHRKFRALISRRPSPGPGLKHMTPLENLASCYRHDFLKNLSLFLFIGVHRRPSAAEFLGPGGFFPERPNGPHDLFLRVPAVDEKSQPRGFFGNCGIENGLSVDAAQTSPLSGRAGRQRLLAKTRLEWLIRATYAQRYLLHRQRTTCRQ